MLKIFISYRREDSAGHVGRLYDHLLAYFDQQDIFHDIDSVGPGADFVDAINDAISNSGVLLTVIGRQWAEIRDLQGNRRLDDPNDLVRLEIATALRKGTVVLPVLVGGAAMPRAEQLPQEIAELTQRNAVELLDKGFKENVTALADRIKPWLIPSGRETEVTSLMCEVRNFTRISERLGPELMFRWLGDTMQSLSESVRDHGGFLIDYIGDELFAMWGAPVDQPDHPERACRAALDMLAKVPGLNDRWLPTIGAKLDLGIGVNTGVSRVGNIGSRIKVKYTPMGQSVNITARLLRLTQVLQTSCLVSQATSSRLGPDFSSRRICTVQMINVVEPVSVYDVAPKDRPDRDTLVRDYEEALGAFEKAEFRLACRILGRILPAHPEDRPTMILMARAVKYLAVPERFEPIFDPTTW